MKFPIARHTRGLLRSTTLFAQDVVDRVTRRATPRLVLRRLNDEVLRFFEKKTPFAETYPYEVHYAPTLENVPQGADAFHLIGRNWRHRPNAPVAIAFGFNMWKFGFMADYCPDVRIAFAPRKFLGLRARRAVKRMRPMPKRIYVWGYTDPRWIARYARRYKIELVRVEDAFLRSADLGANHATPYSLVFDSTGLYYNTAEPNDLSKLLANHDFAGDTALMADAGRALRLIVENGLSKYNLPDTSDPASRLRIKTRRRVLVIGQVDNDAAVRMGNPGGWRMGDIIRLARLENADAEILYRPHPEIYRGHQRTRFKAGLVENIAEIVPPEGSLVELLKTTDQVYTISSLSGLEALIRGVKVTTLGTPFYAGWGPTDDRTAQSRGRTLTPLEIFAAAYLLYPRYLASRETPYLSIETTTLRIIGETAKLRLVSAESDRKRTAPANRTNAFIKSLLTTPGDIAARPVAKNISELLNLFRHYTGRECHRLLLALLSNAEKDDKRFSQSFEAIVGVVDPSAANMFLLDAYKYRPSAQHSRLFSLLIQRDPNSLNAIPVFQSLRPPERGTDDGDNLAPMAEFDHAEEAERLRELGRLNGEAVRIQEALSFFHEAMVLSPSIEASIREISELSFKNFDYKSAYSLAFLYMSGRSQMAPWCLRIIMLSGPYVAPQRVMQEALLFSSEKISALSALAVRLEALDAFKETGFSQESFLETVKLVFDISIPHVHALHELGHFEQALEMSFLIAKRDNTYQSSVVLSKSLCFLDRYEEAEKVIDETLVHHKASLVYDEALKICIYTGNFAKAQSLLAEAETLSIDTGEVLPRKINFGVGNIREAFRTLRGYHTKSVVLKAYKDRYLNIETEPPVGESVLLLPIFGPGDEIRFASIYSLLENYLDFQKIQVGCEPRLLAMFERSFSHLSVEFVPIARTLRDPKPDLSMYASLPSADLMVVMDNNADKLAAQGSRILLVTDLLADLLPDYASFPRAAYLRPDEGKVRNFRAQLPANVALVGINWRSSVSHQTRTEHYLTVEDLVPVFEQTDIQFVNLQYDECAEELSYLEVRFPGRIINIADLDQFNDLDSVAALICALDLIVAPCTTVAELAGALGCPTWLLANSSELKWRQVDDEGGDVWHASMTHVEAATFRNKSSLVERLIDKLIEWQHSHVRDHEAARYAQSKYISPFS